jgi:hypothetical protein
VAAGDAHRAWFPEMVEHLRLRWRDDLSIDALLGLRDELDDMLGRIRSTRHISNPVFKCRVCGHIGRGADPRVSVRATILALARFRVAARQPARALEKVWSAYRKTAGRDLYGPRRPQNPLDSQGVHTSMNGEPKTDLIQLFNRTESLGWRLSGLPGRR